MGARAIVSGCVAAVWLLAGAADVTAQDLALPFDGRWFVLQAGDTLNVNQHMRAPDQAYGVDFAKVGGSHGRELTRREPSRVEDFYSWGERVLAPADGVVVQAVGELPDNALGARDPANPAGNHVVIRIAPDRFVFIAHLKRHSITVATGDEVRRGQTLGACGNSGNTDFPHVHLHVQDTPQPGAGHGRNPVFGPIDVELTGKLFSRVAWPLIRGLFVSNP